MFGDDFQRGVVQERLLDFEGRESKLFAIGDIELIHSTNEPVISLETKNKMFPVIFQAREGGVSYLVVRLLNEFFSPLTSIKVYLFTIFILHLYLSLKILASFGFNGLGPLLIFGISPITLFAYGPYYADALISIFSLGLFLILFKSKKEAPADLLAISGFFTRIVFLWHTVFLFFLFPERRKFFVRSFVYFVILIFCSIALTGLGPENAGREFGSDLLILKNAEATIEFFVKGIEVFLNENAYLNYFTRWEFSLFWTGLFVVSAIFKLYLLLTISWRLQYVLAFAAYYVCVFFMTYHFSSPADYFFPLYLPVYIIFLNSLKAKKKWASSLFLVGQLLISSFFVMNYSRLGPIPAIDAKFHEEATSQMMRTTYFTDNRFYWGLPDYFSSSAVKTIYTEVNMEEKRMKVELCGFNWAEVSFSSSTPERCKPEGEGKVIWHPTRDAYIMLKEKNANEVEK